MLYIQHADNPEIDVYKLSVRLDSKRTGFLCMLVHLAVTRLCFPISLTSSPSGFQDAARAGVRRLICFLSFAAAMSEQSFLMSWSFSFTY